MDGRVLRLAARVHGPWSAAWWGSDPSLEAIFGPAPAEEALRAASKAVAAAAAASPSWRDLLHPGRAVRPPPEALVVLAGQQPILAGGPLLVAYKAATAIALARTLSHRWNQPVVPVFLLADEDHDTGEVDHIDLINPSNGQLHRTRVPITPPHEAFFRARWDPERLDHALRLATHGRLPLEGLSGNGMVPEHVANLLDRVFGQGGLQIVSSHALSQAGRSVFERALTGAGELRSVLRKGAEALQSAGLAVSFDPDDPRPLLLESRRGRRRRVPADDPEALRRLRDHPRDFSPQAALRPIVQAATLPVVAQVVGPSELLYLGQARGIHCLFGLPAPVLVPRMEGTIVPPGFRPADFDAANETTSRLAGSARAVSAAARELADRAAAEAPGLAGRARRWAASVARAADRLAAAPSWHGRTATAQRDALLPRGRHQDAVRPWLPEAVRAGDPAAWAEDLVSFSRPLAPPDHVAYTLGARTETESPHA